MESRRKILLIDEKWDTPLYLALRGEGYEVRACESPEKAWNLVFPLRPDFIILHLHHPSRKDISALHECRALAEGVPIIVATSLPGHEAVMKALEEGATSFLSLPVKPETIRKVLDELDPGANDSSTT
ncbi:MAG: response regulator [Deltaproteobacteria bacterium]|nr:response regulator [Deltaproteobacteria bacterium]